LLVGITIYSKLSSPKEAQGMFQNILLAEDHGTLHDSPKQKVKRLFLFVNLQIKFEQEMTSTIYVQT